MSVIDLSNVINISVSEAPRGLGAYNVNNLALFTRETPLAGFGADPYKIYKNASEVATDFGSASVTAQMAIAVFAQSPNILAGDGYLVVIPFETGETLTEAVTRAKDVIQFFGILAAEITGDSELLLASNYVQTLNKMLFAVKKVATAVDTGEVFETVMERGNDKTRCLLYLEEPGTDTPSLLMSAAYAGRALSTNFSGSNTTQTMHLKDLKTIDVDSNMTQTILEKCKTVGADVYLSLQGVPKVFSTGGNKFFDQVYNRGWFVASLEVAGFNALATTSTKLPQTEQGISVLKGAYRTICEQAVANQYVAPGAWNSPDTFGRLTDFLRNIEERGYYIYSLPVSQQPIADRNARKAPLIQIAIKEAGAVHQSTVMVYINA